MSNGLTKLIAVSKARDPEQDEKYTDTKTINRRLNTQCTLPGCENHLTLYKGPGTRLLCREHQLRMREYGGPGRLDRKWSFWKKDYCEECGHDPRNNVQLAHLDEPLRNTLANMMLHVDHVNAIGKDKYSNTDANHRDNLRTLCMECHMIKTLVDGDHWKEGFHSVETEPKENESKPHQLLIDLE